MKDQKDDKAVPRRQFLKTAGLAAGAAGVAAVALKPTTAAAAMEKDGKSSGYRETEHVRTYYKLARF